MIRFLLSTFTCAIAFAGNAAAYTDQPYRTDPRELEKVLIVLNGERSVEGPATVVTGTTLIVEGLYLWLANTYDLNRHGEVCTAGWQDSLEQAQNANSYWFSDDMIRQCAEAADNGDTDFLKRNTCHVAYTARDQRDALENLIAGRSVKCVLENDAAYQETWDKGHLHTVFGEKLRAAVCYVDGKNLGTTMIDRGLTGYWNIPTFVVFHRDRETDARLSPERARKKVGPYLGENCYGATEFAPWNNLWDKRPGAFILEMP